MKKHDKVKFSLIIQFTWIIFISFLISMLIVLFATAIMRWAGIDFRAFNTILILVFGFAVSLILGTLFAVLFFKRTVNLADDLKMALKRISKGDYSVRLENTSDNKDGILYDVIENFNKMVEELDSVTILRNDFISNFSHEFKTPIVSIKGYAELIKNGKNLTEEQKQEYLQVIIDESRRLSNLASSTLLMSKLDSQTSLTETSVFSVNEQLKQCVLVLDNEFKAKNLEVKIKLGKMRVDASVDMLQQVWINLLTNAIKYTPENGIIRITSTELEKEYIVSISDNGMGMNEETLKHIFDKYYQGDNSHSTSGNGLGLSIAKRIVELSGGKIEASSTEGKGTTFSVRLPKLKEDYFPARP
ncbi:MAG TPA: HAMP domain-containing histidine kinase [Candidatus Caccopulliclostridium gallistercoris]|uniref:Heme sensor protein HssS n=1 Tax=Candidatus Caccopulliclostridium gallistercoris TaxID=2840719 RepID=A0A9D1NE54_9FIRM|nr:HAMP domain-containing histidine kinase [Candidatus Caccopulliclostridium gallistercoris]